MTEQSADLDGVRCYSCGHHYAARPDQIETACPECGSDSFTRVTAEPHAEQGGATRRPGEVVRYAPDPSRHDPRWCREGYAIRDDGGVLVDTYWQSGGDAHLLNAVELASVEHLFWLDDYHELDRYRPGSADEWATYAPADRQVVTSQHGLQRRWFVRLGATPDLGTQLENALQALRDAQYELERAQQRLEHQEERVDELRDRISTPPGSAGPA